MWKEALTAVWLLPMSALDIKYRKVPVWMIWMGTAAAIFVLICEGTGGQLSAWKTCRALIPGIILLLIAAVTQKAGAADGVILMILGIFMGYEGCVAASLGGLFLISLLSGALLEMRRAKKNTKIPFVPFLAVGWLAVLCERWGGI